MLEGFRLEHEQYTYIYIYTRIYKHIACINTKKHYQVYESN